VHALDAHAAHPGPFTLAVTHGKSRNFPASPRTI
jgi:hypothetical protein